jgi:hypothetical protein
MSDERPLRSIPAVRIDVGDEQLRAVGHVALQWALLEAEIDREIVWLSVGAENPQNLGAKFEDRVQGWQRLATDRMSDRPDLIEDVKVISEQALAIKVERDKLITAILEPAA